VLRQRTDAVLPVLRGQVVDRNADPIPGTRLCVTRELDVVGDGELTRVPIRLAPDEINRIEL
jgi:hypothetical protein